MASQQFNFLLCSTKAVIPIVIWIDHLVCEEKKIKVRSLKHLNNRAMDLVLNFGFHAAIDPKTIEGQIFNCHQCGGLVFEQEDGGQIYLIYVCN